MNHVAPAPTDAAAGRAGPEPSRQVRSVAENRAIAAKLEEYASLLEQQQANPFRVKAYERAAQVIAGLGRPVGEILFTEGQQGLTDLPGIGVAIAGAVAQLATTGRWPQLERLRGTLEPEALFRTLPGVGARLAHGLAEDLHLDSLEALENAASDGSLGRVEGWGRKRVAMVRAAVAERLGRTRLRARAEAAPRPPVDLILDVDREYRLKAAAGTLRRIAPKRFNPSHEAWLPILHAERGPWSFTALYSNTARAHELRRAGDWVVIYHHTDSELEGQCTVVTETRGPMAGRRVVRGRETECLGLSFPGAG
ncbi:MAG: hypothetical protein ACHP84_18235 [Caulobacterales bacterium]